MARAGSFLLSPALDHTGTLAASVAEAALALDAITDGAGWRPASAAIGQGVVGLTVGFARDWYATDPQAHPALIAALDAAAAALQGARHMKSEVACVARYMDAVK